MIFGKLFQLRAYLNQKSNIELFGGNGDIFYLLIFCTLYFCQYGIEHKNVYMYMYVHIDTCSLLFNLIQYMET